MSKLLDKLMRQTRVAGWQSVHQDTFGMRQDALTLRV